MSEQCSFCATSSASGARLIQGGGPELGGLPVVYICEECITSSYDAIRTERRIGKARASEAPPPLLQQQAEDRTAFGRISDWTRFEMEDLRLEWRAERTLATSRLPLVLMTVRRKGETGGTLLELEGNIEPHESHAVEALAWLGSASKSAELGVVRDWTPFEAGGQAYEWRAVRVLGVRARAAVWVHVRNADTGVGTMMQFDGETEPSVEDAVMVASDAEDVLRQAPGG
jgi:hypothetical protein